MNKTLGYFSNIISGIIKTSNPFEMLNASSFPSSPKKIKKIKKTDGVLLHKCDDTIKKFICNFVENEEDDYKDDEYKDDYNVVYENQPIEEEKMDETKTVIQKKIEDPVKLRLQQKKQKEEEDIKRLENINKKLENQQVSKPRVVDTKEKDKNINEINYKNQTYNKYMEDSHSIPPMYRNLLDSIPPTMGYIWKNIYFYGTKLEDKYEAHTVYMNTRFNMEAPFTALTRDNVKLIVDEIMKDSFMEGYQRKTKFQKIPNRGETITIKTQCGNGIITIKFKSYSKNMEQENIQVKETIPTSIKENKVKQSENKDEVKQTENIKNAIEIISKLEGKGKTHSKICLMISKRGRCKKEYCHFAHTLEEFTPIPCLFDEECRYKSSTCPYLHKGEDKHVIVKRLNVKFPQSDMTSQTIPSEPKTFISKPAPWAIPQKTNTEHTENIQKPKMTWNMTTVKRSSLSDIMREQITEPIIITNEIKPEQPKFSGIKLKMCSLHMENKCFRKICNFAHHFDEMGLCQFDTECNRFDTCPFKHSKETAMSFVKRTGQPIPHHLLFHISEPKPQPKRVPMPTYIPYEDKSDTKHKMKMCTLHIEGKCRRTICNFAHYFEEMGFCMYGDNCRNLLKPCIFRHPHESGVQYSKRTGMKIPMELLNQKKRMIAIPRHLALETIVNINQPDVNIILV